MEVEDFNSRDKVRVKKTGAEGKVCGISYIATEGHPRAVALRGRNDETIGWFEPDELEILARADYHTDEYHSVTAP